MTPIEKIVAAFSVAVAASMFALSASAADIAWEVTPNLWSFREFVDPQSTKVEGKGLYLYGLVIMQAVWFGIAAYRFLVGRFQPYQYFIEPRFRPYTPNSLKWWPAYWAAVTFAAFLITWAQASRAMDAAGHAAPRFSDIVMHLPALL